MAQRSEHDLGYNLGLQRALDLLEQTKKSTLDSVDSRKEKEAVFKVYEILKISLNKQLLK